MIPLFFVIVVGVILLVVFETTNVTKYSFSQLLDLANGAGFSGQDAVTAAAVALAESGGNPKAYNPEIRAGTSINKGSYGLWQIYLQDHPEFEGVDLYDPQVNADAAYRTYRTAGNSFAPWSTYNSKIYLSHVPAEYS